MAVLLSSCSGLSSVSETEMAERSSDCMSAAETEKSAVKISVSPYENNEYNDSRSELITSVCSISDDEIKEIILEQDNEIEAVRKAILSTQKGKEIKFKYKD